MLIASLLVGLFVEWESEYSPQKLGTGPDRAFQSKRKEDMSTAIISSRKLSALWCRWGGLFPFCFDHRNKNKHQKFQIWSKAAFFLLSASAYVVVAIFLQESQEAEPEFRLWCLIAKYFGVPNDDRWTGLNGSHVRASRRLVHDDFMSAYYIPGTVIDHVMSHGVGVTIHSFIHPSWLCPYFPPLSSLLSSFLPTYLPTKVYQLSQAHSGSRQSIKDKQSLVK